MRVTARRVAARRLYRAGDGMARYDTFIVRVWRSVGVDGPQWSGRIEHVQQADTHQFGTVQALLDHLRTVAGPLPDAAIAPDGAQAEPEGPPHAQQRRKPQGGQ